MPLFITAFGLSQLCTLGHCPPMWDMSQIEHMGDAQHQKFLIIIAKAFFWSGVVKMVLQNHFPFFMGHKTIRNN